MFSSLEEGAASVMSVFWRRSYISYAAENLSQKENQNQTKPNKTKQKPKQPSKKTKAKQKKNQIQSKPKPKTKTQHKKTPPEQRIETNTSESPEMRNCCHSNVIKTTHLNPLNSSHCSALHCS